MSGIGSKLTELLGSLLAIARGDLFHGGLYAFNTGFEVSSPGGHGGLVGGGSRFVSPHSLALGSQSVAVNGHRLLVLADLLSVRSDSVMMLSHRCVVSGSFVTECDILVDTVSGSGDAAGTAVKTAE